MDLKRHAPLGRVCRPFAPASLRSRPHAYAGRPGALLPEIYASDHADGRRTGRFRWVLSTCLAATVGGLAILVAVAGSMDAENRNFAGLQQRLRQASVALSLPAGAEGLRWAVPKADKMQIPTGVIAVKSYIPEPIKQRRGQREYTLTKFYMRLAARLGPVANKEAAAIPQFDPFKLYAATAPVGKGESADGSEEAAAPTKIIELNGLLPDEDGQRLDTRDVIALVTRAQTAEAAAAAAAAQPPAEQPQEVAASLPAQTTVLPKTVFEPEAEEPDFQELAPVTVERGDTLRRILARLGAQPSQLPAILAAARQVVPDNGLLPGYVVRATVQQDSAHRGSKLIRFSILDRNGAHKVTVTRRSATTYVASAKPVEDLPRVALADSADQDHSLYASVYHLAAAQGIPDRLIMRALRIHAPETDFRRRVRAGDSIELFFGLKGEERGVEGDVDSLLATFITTGGQTRKFYRFRSSDGVVDFYDPQGNTARKFLMRLPVRGPDVRLTSGYGMRTHPLLRTPRMHTGEDWACAPGTPIMAAGAGVIEMVGPKGQNGNMVRIRHANGYKTAYAHMSGFAPGMAVGVKVRQGQVIGYVGSTGFSSGPHVHFGVYVRNRDNDRYQHVNPATIPVPNERQLKGKDLADFKRERARIDDLMRRHPVRGPELPS